MDDPTPTPWTLIGPTEYDNGGTAQSGMTSTADINDGEQPRHREAVGTVTLIERAGGAAVGSNLQGGCRPARPGSNGLAPSTTGQYWGKQPPTDAGHGEATSGRTAAAYRNHSNRPRTPSPLRS